MDYLFLSHMDFDHTSGLCLVQNVKRIMAAEEELTDSKKYFFRYVKTNWDFAKKSLDWICECAQDENCILVAANHDPTIREQIITL
ncbi:MAG: hypothetical protein ACI4E3_00755 [Candidatus Fimousia sp.]